MADLISADHPLWLPEGSVRAVLALAVVGAFIAGALDAVEIVTLVLGFYFGTRAAAA